MPRFEQRITDDQGFAGQGRGQGRSGGRGRGQGRGNGQGRGAGQGRGQGRGGGAKAAAAGLGQRLARCLRLRRRDGSCQNRTAKQTPSPGQENLPEQEG
jgi:hypothetical protein